ncbi:phospholipase ABHD3 isoform X2 [Dendrobates tinctorius]|uniref:phospholipase ABHD3 isoform X2 n=1 Tax=Dendrobates tinctorius TaxID=92724 RepID=UPI003CC9A715
MLGSISLQGLTRELSLYLESQVRVGLFGSGVGLSLVLGFGAAYACYYLTVIAKKPQLVTGGEAFCRFLKQRCPAVTETYYPTPWCWEGRAQTLLRPFITVKPVVHYTKCVVFNNRGVAGEDLLTPRTYCAANTEDLETVIQHVHARYPEAPLMAAGVSMGGMLLLNYLGKTGRQTPLLGAAVFSAGWEVFESATVLEKTLNWILFNYYLTTCLQASIMRHRSVLEKQFDIDYVMKARSIREFDTRFTSVMFGYPTNDHYYKDASPCHRVKSIEIPVLCLNAVDDVFSPGHAIPVESAKQNPNVALVLTAYGGHIGFLEGIWPRQQTYMDRIFKQFAKAVFEHGSELPSM